MKKQLLLIIICFITIVAPNSLKAMETPEDVLSKELIHQLTGPIGSVVGNDWFRGNEKILEIKNDERHSDILYVTVQVVSFQGPHNPPYVEEIITFKIVGDKIKPIDYFNRVIPESEWHKFHIPTGAKTSDADELLINYPMTIRAKETKYNHSSITIPEIKKKVNFTILTPKKIPDDWTLDTKISPWVMLHYMDSKDRKLMVAIHLSRRISLSDEDFPSAQRVDINGNKGYFSKWVDSGKLDKNGELITGGLLRWIQAGTYVEMQSSRLPKEKMLEIARSMN